VSHVRLYAKSERLMHVTFDRTEPVTDKIITFWFTPERALHYSAGQFVGLQVLHPEPDERGQRRWFTLSSSPTENQLAITTAFSPDGSSFKKALASLRPGQRLSMSDPMGDFVLPKDPSIPLVFIAAGTGCTPYVSMIKWLRDRDERRSIVFIYSASSADAFIFTDLWKSYTPLTYVRMVSHPTDSWSEKVGRLHAEAVLDIIKTTQGKLIYLAGPQGLIEPLYDDMLKANTPRNQLLLDYFTGYS
jgi:glycine betaine catabolism B